MAYYNNKKVAMVVKVVGGGKFSRLVDKSITQVTAGDLAGITKIGQMVFYLCQNLTSIDIPSTVTEIGSLAFYRCIALTSITINATTPPTLMDINAFDNTNNCPIYVPAESVTAYQTATNWASLASRIQAIQA